MKPCSELKLPDIKPTVDSLRPLKIIVNKKVIWDEDYDDMSKYEAIFRVGYIVTEIKFTIVSWHHSYVEITTI